MLLDTLEATTPDAILAIAEQFRADPRPEKLDLSVGVYRDASGETVIMQAIKKAEHQLLQEQRTKTYVGLAGDSDFNQAMANLVLGPDLQEERLATTQTPGGGGALRMLADLVARATANVGGEATVWVSEPTWPNHSAILHHAGLRHRTYPYLDCTTGLLNFDAMMTGLQAASVGDVLLLHGCCHNPSGADLTLDQWKTLSEIVTAQGLVPFVDLAYQGFGDGLEADVAGLRTIADAVPEMLLAVSCSKNFAIYRERVGCAMVLCQDAAQASVTANTMQTLARANYSMPPDHGAAVVRIILQDPSLYRLWANELQQMRIRVQSLRTSLVSALNTASNSSRFDFLANHQGMFSLLGLSSAQIDRLRDESGIYIVGDSRINVAGLREEKLAALANALVKVGA